jgi:hypothetical protein
MRSVDPVQHLLFSASRVRVGQRQLAPSLGGEAVWPLLGLG